MKLDTIENIVDNYLEIAAKDNKTTLEVLDYLVDQERQMKENTARGRKIRLAMFPAQKRLEDFDLDFQPSIDKAVISDKSHGLNGFLNETVAELRHVVSTVQSAQEIGIVKKEQVINIIDSVVQRSSFGRAGSGGEGGASVNIEGSLVQRTEFNAGEDRRVEEERLKKEKEKQRKEEEELLHKKQEEEKKQKEEHELKMKMEQQRLERERKAQEERERIEAAAALKEKEQFKVREQEALVQKQRIEHQKSKPKSRKNTFMLAIVLGALLVGFAIVLGAMFVGVAMFPPDSGDVADVSSISTQPEVPESIEPTYSQQSEVEPEVSQTPAPSSNQKTYTNSIYMEFVLIPAGEFKMGSPLGEEGRYDYEGPLHTVKIGKAYYLGKYEVTQKQWREVMGDNPSDSKGDDRPVEQVSWNDAQEFIKKLNQKEGTDKYRLPSEAEWEYAARAGTTTRYSFGDSESRLGEYAWYEDNSGIETHPVGQKRQNPWGLYDMHGNVFEWTQDKWHADFHGAPTDGSAWDDGDSSDRVLRGGGWYGDARRCRSASRYGFDPDARGGSVGFRLLRIP